jgi:Na+/melibiose symporter-like transporter
MWDFSDPVVFLAVFTMVFGIGMLIFLFFWVRKNMNEAEKEPKNK